MIHKRRWKILLCSFFGLFYGPFCETIRNLTYRLVAVKTDFALFSEYLSLPEFLLPEKFKAFYRYCRSFLCQDTGLVRTVWKVLCRLHVGRSSVYLDVPRLGFLPLQLPDIARDGNSFGMWQLCPGYRSYMVLISQKRFHLVLNWVCFTGEHRWAQLCGLKWRLACILEMLALC